MKLIVAASYLATILGGGTPSVNAQGQMVKMCLFYDSPSGYARSDPIITQTCASGHVHTFYGPQNFHPNTSYEDIRDTSPEFSTTPFIENQSLYWHPTIYEVVDNTDGTQTFTRAPGMDTSPYYRWDNSVLPLTETFPPGFRMIAASNDPGATAGGEFGENMFTECCDISDDEEECDSWERLEFPSRNCDFLGIAFAMPTCWDGVSLGDDNDHKSHMAFTVDGRVAGACPDGFNHRLPQIQVFVRVPDYRGSDRRYQLSDGQSEWHVDFMNGWEEGKLAEIIQDCPVQDQDIDEYNPECGCEEFLTPNDNPAGAMCDSDVRRLIIDEATDTTSSLPSGTCQGEIIDKSWEGPDLSTVSLDDCGRGGGSDESESGDGSDESGDDSDSGGLQLDGLCFSPDATAMVKDKGKVPMKDLAVGDDVLTASGKYQTVYTINHFHHTKPTNFLQIHTDLENALEVSAMHLVYVEGEEHPVPALDIKVGDYLQTLNHGPLRVNYIKVVTRDGLYNPITVDSTMLVDGIITSSYTSFTGSAHLEIAGVKIISVHDLLDITIAPYRALCMTTTPVLNLCNQHGEDELPPIVELLSKFYHKFFSKQHALVQFAVISLYLSIFGLIQVILSEYSIFMVAAIASYFYISRRDIQKKSTQNTVVPIFNQAKELQSVCFKEDELQLR